MCRYTIHHLLHCQSSSGSFSKSIWTAFRRSKFKSLIYLELFSYPSTTWQKDYPQGWRIIMKEFHIKIAGKCSPKGIHEHTECMCTFFLSPFPSVMWVSIPSVHLWRYKSPLNTMIDKQSIYIYLFVRHLSNTKLWVNCIHFSSYWYAHCYH